MDKVSKVQPGSKVNNNSKSLDAYSQGERRDNRSLEQKLLYEHSLELEKMKARISELEKIKKGLESKIVTAPVKTSEVKAPVRHDINRVNISQMDRYAGQKRAIQAYTGVVRPKTRPATTQVNSYRQPVAKPQVNPQTSIAKIEPKKMSIWDKIKSFFIGPEKKTTTNQYANNANTWSNQNKPTNNYTRTTNYTARSEQYRKSMAANINITHNPKNTQSQYRSDPNKGKRLDRYV